MLDDGIQGGGVDAVTAAVVVYLNDQQTCSREIAEVISGKTGCPGGDAVEKSAEPTDILCEF